MARRIVEIEKHLSWQLADDMREICKPFFEKLNITYVDYARFYSDGRVVLLYTDKNYVNYFMHDEVLLKPPNKIITTGLHLWSEYIDLDFLKRVSGKFRHAHGVTIATEMNDYKEIFNIATTPENIKILDLYLNQQSIIHQLIDYFRKKAKKLIHKLEDHPLIIPTAKIEYPLPESPLHKLSSEITDLLRTDSESYIIQVNNISIPLSRREAQCLYFLHQGKTAKEMGRILSISNRTIEVYLDQIRFKTASKNRMEVIGKIDHAQIQRLISVID